MNWAAIAAVFVPLFTAAGGWMVGRKRQDNIFLRDLQSSIDMLSSRNKELYNEVITLRGENAKLLMNQENLKIEVEKLREENCYLRKEVETLNEHLSNVKTITRKA